MEWKVLLHNYTSPQPYPFDTVDNLKKRTTGFIENFYTDAKVTQTVNGHLAASDSENTRYVIEGEYSYTSDATEEIPSSDSPQEYEINELDADFKLFDASVPFFSASAPMAMFFADVDDDNDEDIVVRYSDGRIEVSYSVLSQAMGCGAVEDDSSFRRSCAMFKDGTEVLRDDVAAWLNDHFERHAACFGIAALADLFELKIRAFQYYALSYANFGNTDRSVARRLRGYIDLAWQTPQDLLSFEDSSVERDGNFFRLLSESSTRSFVDGLLDAVGAEHLGIDTSCADLPEDKITAYTDEVMEYVNLTRKMGGDAARMLGVNDGGIGVQIDHSSKGAIIKSIVNGGPAESAGLLAGDLIVRINGTSVQWIFDSTLTTTLPVDRTLVEAARKAIIGPLGSEIELTVERGRKQFAVSMKRDFNISVLAFSSMP